jgi:hypothetical protein
MLFDDECYLMPEEIGIPQHIQRVLKSPSFPIDYSRTLPHLSQIRNREVSGSLPNVSENSNLRHEPWAMVCHSSPRRLAGEKKSYSYNHKTTIWVSHEYYLNPEFHKIPARAF